MEALAANATRPRTPDFERPADFDVRYAERLPFQYGPATVPAQISFDPAVAWRAERLARGHGSVTMLDDGSALWTVEAADLRRLASWIIDEGAGLRAVGPPDLVRECRDGLHAVVVAHG
jgi:hypothetical protein